MGILNLREHTRGGEEDKNLKPAFEIVCLIHNDITIGRLGITRHSVVGVGEEGEGDG